MDISSVSFWEWICLDSASLRSSMFGRWFASNCLDLGLGFVIPWGPSGYQWLQAPVGMCQHPVFRRRAVDTVFALSYTFSFPCIPVTQKWPLQLSAYPRWRLMLLRELCWPGWSQEDKGLSGFGPGSALEGPVCLGLRGETFSDLPLLTGMAFFPFLCVVGLFESLWPPCWSSFRPQLGPESRPVFHPTSLRERGSPPPSTAWVLSGGHGWGHIPPTHPPKTLHLRLSHQKGSLRRGLCA